MDKELKLVPAPVAAHGTRIRAAVCSDVCTEGCAEVRMRMREQQRAKYERQRDPNAPTRRSSYRVRTEQLVPVTTDMLLGIAPPIPRPAEGTAPHRARKPRKEPDEYEGRSAYLKHLDDLFK